jgi:hypothetical protein
MDVSRVPGRLCCCLSHGTTGRIRWDRVSRSSFLVSMNRVRVGTARTIHSGRGLTIRAIRDCLILTSLLDFGIPYVPSLAETPIPLPALVFLGAISWLLVFPEFVYTAVESLVRKRQAIIASPSTIPIALVLFGLTSVGELFVLFRGLPPVLLAVLIGFIGYGLSKFLRAIRDTLLQAQQRVRANKTGAKEISEITRNILVFALCSGRLLGFGTSLFLWQRYQSLSVIGGGISISLIILLFAPLVEPGPPARGNFKGPKRSKTTAPLSPQKMAILGLPAGAKRSGRFRRHTKRKSQGSVCTSGSDRLLSRAAICVKEKQGAGPSKSQSTPGASRSGRLEALRKLATGLSSRMARSTNKTRRR